MKHNKYYESFLNIRNMNLVTGIEPEYLQLIQNFFDNVDPAVYYMLEGRFQKNIKSKKATLPSSEELIKLLESHRLVKRSRKKGQNIKPLDIIKGFKILEQQLYHNGEIDKSSFDNLSIGEYKECLVKCSDSITTLLLCIQNIPAGQARALLSLLHTGICIYRQFGVKAEASKDTITLPYSGTMELDEVTKTYFTDEKIDRFINRFLDKSKIFDHDKLFIYSGNASSPNSGHSSINFLQDAAGLYKDKTLFDNVMDLAHCFSNGTNLKNIVDVLIDNATWDRNYMNDKLHSRIVTFTAPGGKARIIVVADWITQTALSAIHKTQFQLLQQIPADRTFDHKSGLDLYDENAESFISVDLSAATDRLPRVLQARIIDRLYTILGMDGSKIARHWLASVDREYDTTSSFLEKQAKVVRYSVGQGMGLFSSWSSMALTHHFIVNELCGIDVSNYRLVGDDLLLRNSEEQYSAYCDIFDKIGVSVNPAKTLVSKNKPHTLEFARNYIILSHKIDPLPMGIVFSYYDEKTSGSEVFYNFIHTLDFIDPLKLLELLKITDFKEMHIIAYFIWKQKKLPYERINSILISSHVRGLAITEAQFQTILEICESKKDEPSIQRRQVIFVESLLSQCTMRREEDLAKTAILGRDVPGLIFRSQDMRDYSEVMRERIRGATPVYYLPGLGNPTASKKERRLIFDFLHFLFKQDKSLKPPKQLKNSKKG